MKKIFLIIFVAFVTNTNAQTWITIPDANFVAYLQALIPTAMNGNQLNTSSTLVTTTTHSINVSSKSIANLNGIQYFTSLTYLHCYNNSLSSIPTLPASLTYLNCQQNFITGLPTLPASLTYLNCGSNSLTNLPALPASLINLTCYTNLLTNLPVLPNSLVYVDCDNNSLSSIPTLPNSLKSLYCDSNDITCFPIFPDSITNMGINGNPFSCLPNYVLPVMNSYTTTPLCTAGNTNGCAVAGIEQYSQNTNISIFPNPTSGVVYLNLSAENAGSLLVNISDVNGNQLLHNSFDANVGANSFKVDLGSLNQGVYFIRVTDENGVPIKNDKLMLIGQ